MSKLLKSKFFLGALVAVALAAGASSAAAYTHTVTLKMGMTNSQVMSLQQTLNMTACKVGAVGTSGGPGTETMYFGAKTKAAVQCFQASKGLTADGIVGPMTGAALAAVTGTVAVYPAGCTSNAGYSPTTGLPCSGGATLPAGCTSTAGYSPTTGAKCDSTGGTPTSTGPLMGGAGSASISETSTDVEDTVNEGDVARKVYGFKIEAQDSDVAVTNVKVSFEADGAGASSLRLSHYADKVSVWMGSTKVGSADVADFSKDGDVYSKSIALSNAVVREGSGHKQTFYIAVDALSNIDTADFDANWTVTLDNVRYNDATGAILTLVPSDFTSGDETHGFQFSSLALSGDTKLVVSRGSANPLAQNVEVSDTSSTSDVLLLEFKLKDTGSDMTFDSIDLALDGSVTQGGVDGNAHLADMLSELTLKHGSDVLGTESSFTNSSDDETVTLNLDDTYTLAKDTTDTFRVYGKLADVDNYDSGNTLKVSFDDISAEDTNGDVVTETGSANGEVQTFLNQGAAVQFVSSSYTAANDTDNVDGTISMKFTVTAIGDSDVTIAENQDAGTVTDGSPSNAAGAGVVVFTLTGADSNGAIITSSTTTKDGSDNFTVSAGSTETFTLSVKTKFDTTSGFVRLAINNVDDTAVSNTVQTPAY